MTPASALAARTKGAATTVAAEYLRNSRRLMKSSLDGAHYSGLYPRGFLAPAHDSDINVDCIVLRDCRVHAAKRRFCNKHHKKHNDTRIRWAVAHRRESVTKK
jgi:hypothetical protein